MKCTLSVEIAAEVSDLSEVGHLLQSLRSSLPEGATLAYGSFSLRDEVSCANLVSTPEAKQPAPKPAEVTPTPDAPEPEAQAEQREEPAPEVAPSLDAVKQYLELVAAAYPGSKPKVAEAIRASGAPSLSKLDDAQRADFLAAIKATYPITD